MNLRVAITAGSERGAAMYAEALGAAAPDLTPCVLHPAYSPAALESELAGAAALLLTGGPDVHPERYGDLPKGTEMEHVLPARDALERWALLHADARSWPVLAICRGMQMLNVHRGGGLLQDIGRKHRDGRAQDEKWRPHHPVEVDSESRLGALISTSRAEVNSRHHQAVDPARLGSGLRVIARCPSDGIVESVEAEGPRFVLGVQWHPENTALAPEPCIEREQAQAIFSGFAAAVRGFAESPAK
jgi:putative glutamine amidotransferase